MQMSVRGSVLNTRVKYIILKFIVWGQRKMAQNVPSDHHVTILFFLFAYVECYVVADLSEL